MIAAKAQSDASIACGASFGLMLTPSQPGAYFCRTAFTYGAGRGGVGVPGNGLPIGGLAGVGPVGTGLPGGVGPPGGIGLPDGVGRPGGIGLSAGGRPGPWNCEQSSAGSACFRVRQSRSNWRPSASGGCTCALNWYGSATVCVQPQPGSVTNTNTDTISRTRRTVRVSRIRASPSLSVPSNRPPYSSNPLPPIWRPCGHAGALPNLADEVPLQRAERDAG